MKMGEALAEVKSLKGKLSQLYSELDRARFIVEGRKGNPDFKELLNEYIKVSIDLRALRVTIQKRNQEIHVSDGGVTLANALMRIADFRSMISQLNGLLNPSPFGSPERLNEDDKLVLNFDKDTLKEYVDNLISEKIKLDNIIQQINWREDIETPKDV